MRLMQWEKTGHLASPFGSGRFQVRRLARWAGWLGSASLVSACFSLRSSRGGGEISEPGQRRLDPTDIAVPADYVVELVATGLTFPTSVTFDSDNQLHVVESGYAYGEKFATARLLRLDAAGTRAVVAESRNGPWTGAIFHAGNFYVAEGGVLEGGRILRITRQGSITELVRDLPSRGDHHTNGPALGSDGWLYFGQGTATNSGVAGKDNYDFGWLKRNRRLHDVPCRDVTLTGESFETENFLAGAESKVKTGAFVPFGTATRAGQVIEGQVPCNGAILRVRLEGGEVELVAWGLRNPFGLAFDASNALYVTDNGADVRGSRPIFGAADALWRIQPGAWYGWPDFSEGRPAFDHHYKPPESQTPPRLLASHPGVPPRPVAYLPVHASADGLDFSRSGRFGYEGQAFVALFGDQAPQVGKTWGPVGYKIVRVNVQSGRIDDFAVNRGDTNGPASRLERGGLERPISVRFDATGDALYVVDFGIMTMSESGASAQEGTGVIWRIRRGQPS